MGFLKKIKRRFLKQAVVLWTKRDVGPTGGALYNDPVECKGRWEDQDNVVETAPGKSSSSSAYVLLDRNAPKDSLVWLGSLAEWEASPAYPKPPTFDQGGRRVLKVKRTPDLSGGPDMLYEVYA